MGGAPAIASLCERAVQREANQLVEEFMLLANMSVAKIVADAFPDRALLRRHPPPDEKKLSAVLDLAKSLVCCIPCSHLSSPCG